MKISLRDLTKNDWRYFTKWWRDEELINLTSGDHTFLSDGKSHLQFVLKSI